ncbi:MAG: hypothetical protein PHE06_00215 [Lachnospiraceae bacterium]|nr:hypothetical protein [Lachnospiraceae bacterium]
MKYIWTEDTGAGLHYWKLVKQYLLSDEYKVESKQSNQGLLDAVRVIDLSADNTYFIAFDIVYDNMDIMNKYLDLSALAKESKGNIKLIDTTCFEYIILAFTELIHWTECGRKDKIAIRENILRAMNGHQIDLDQITDEKTLQYLMGFRRYSTERVMKSLVNELTDQKKWSVKGTLMGKCWYQDCCVMNPNETCDVNNMSGEQKVLTLLRDYETSRLLGIFDGCE